MIRTIGIFARSDESGFPGGDTVQSEAISSFLMRYGYDVRRLLLPEQDLNEVDLVIIFNLTRPIEAYVQAHAALSAHIPYVIFPVYWNLDRLKMNGTFLDMLKEIVPQGLKEHLRWRRFVRGNPEWDRINQRNSDPILGHTHAMIQYVLDHALYVLPNSQAEGSHLAGQYSLANTKVKVIYNGYYESQVDQFPVMNDFDPPDHYVCCVGAIGPRKNQLTLVRAANQTGVHLVVVGGGAPGAEGYERLVRRVAGPTVHFLGRQPRERVMSIMRDAYGHIQPSYIETPGLASLEAASLGCPIAVSDVAPVREYFGSTALYCDPHSVRSVAGALLRLQDQPKPARELARFVSSRFTWDKVLSPLLQVVREVKDRQCVR